MSQTKINIKTKDLELTNEIREKINEKITHIEKFLNPTDDQEIIADVEVGKNFDSHKQKGDVFRAEINLRTNGEMFRADSKTFDIIVAIDEVAAEIVKQIRRKKGRNNDLMRRGGKAIKKMLKFGRE
jgi:ribosomal subunit interface protein